MANPSQGEIGVRPEGDRDAGELGVADQQGEPGDQEAEAHERQRRPDPRQERPLGRKIDTRILDRLAVPEPTWLRTASRPAHLSPADSGATIRERRTHIGLFSHGDSPQNTLDPVG